MLSPLAASPSPLATQTQRAQTQSKPQTRPQSTTIMEQRSGTSSNVAQGRLDKQDAKLLSIARDGVLGEFSEDFLEDVEGLLQLGNSLEDAVAKAKDDQRADKIARIEQRIEALKERLKFASPAQAKALIRELKQLGQDFKLAAQSLSDGGSKAAAGQSAAGSSITLSASSSSASLSDASASAVLAEGEVAIETANALLGLPAGSDPTADKASSAASASGGANPQASGAEETGEGAESTSARLLLEVREAIATYNSTQVTVKAYGSAYDGSARKQADYDKLRELEKQIDLLAEQIGALADKDDEEQRKELEAAKREMDEGREALNEFRTDQLEAQGMPGVEGSAGGVANLFTGLNGSQGAETGVPAGTSGVSVSINQTAISFSSTSVSLVLQTDVTV
ncbi:hypothetical protein V6L76_13945 [Pannonibacter sp. Pt2]|uniref:Uncharacterized protein n=1 Tax=Pannonibacter anstelovis TaxID=3121537 RepID=A0ABU7ZQ58_9HYPH